MNGKRLRPPALATWMLLRLTPAKNREELTGDLFERFDEGRSDLWFWRECLIAILVGFTSELRAHWSHICFALAGTALLMPAPWPPHWYSAEYWLWNRSPVYRTFIWDIHLQWPLSSIYGFVIPATFNVLIVAPFLVTLLVLNKAVSWANMFRLLLFSILLVATGDLVVFLTSSTYWGWAHDCLIFLALLISTWMGCPAPADSKAAAPSEP